MPDEPSGVERTPQVPQYGRDKPRLGEGEEAQEPKPFSLSPESGKGQPSEAQTTRPSPMEVARDQERSKQPIPKEELSNQINHLKNGLFEAQQNLSNTNITNKFSQDHYTALQTLTDKMNPDMKNIAKYSDGDFVPPKQAKGESVLNYITKWLNGSQETLGKSLNFLSHTQNPNPATYLQLQFSVQRAVQRGELFASIVGSSVSGIKTIMSTQLG